MSPLSGLLRTYQWDAAETFLEQHEGIVADFVIKGLLNGRSPSCCNDPRYYVPESLINAMVKKRGNKDSDPEDILSSILKKAMWDASLTLLDMISITEELTRPRGCQASINYPLDLALKQEAPDDVVVAIFNAKVRSEKGLLEYDMQSIHQTIRARRWVCATALLTTAEIGFAFTAIPGEGGLLPLHAAIKHGAPEDFVISLLEQNVGAATALDNSNFTPLHYAVRDGATYEVVKKLLLIYPKALDRDPSPQNLLYRGKLNTQSRDAILKGSKYWCRNNNRESHFTQAPKAECKDTVRDEIEELKTKVELLERTVNDMRMTMAELKTTSDEVKVHLDKNGDKLMDAAQELKDQVSKLQESIKGN